MVEGLADIRNILSYQSEIIALRGQVENQINEENWSEIQKALASWPSNQFQSILDAELRKGIDTAIARVAEQFGQTGPPVSTAIGGCHPDCVTLLDRHQKGKVAVSRSYTTKSMLFGEMHYTSTSYRNNPKLTSTLDMPKNISKEQLQVEKSFSFVPSWWVTRFMTARAIKVDMLKLSTQGWQAKINSFNVRKGHEFLLFFLMFSRLSQKSLQYLSSVVKAISMPWNAWLEVEKHLLMIWQNTDGHHFM